MKIENFNFNFAATLIKRESNCFGLILCIRAIYGIACC